MEKLKGKVAELTRQEWNDLGFYYSSNDDVKRWDLFGTTKGLERLSEELGHFTKKDEVYGAHEHLLPHWYLTIEFDESPDINKRGIVGRKQDLIILRDYIVKNIPSLSVDSSFSVHDCFDATSYEMYFHIQNDDFDPSSMDWQLQS